MLYRLNFDAMRLLRLMNLGKAQYEKLMNDTFADARASVSHGKDTLALADPRWFEEAEVYKKDAWNDCKKVRPPKEDVCYLVRWPESGGAYGYGVSEWSLPCGFVHFERAEKMEFREMPR